MAGYITLSGALAAMDYLAGFAAGNVLQAEWNAKAAAGDPLPRRHYLMLLNQALPADSSTSMATMATLEVAGTGYARQPVPWAGTTSPGRTLASADLVQFGPFAAAGGLGVLHVTGAALVTRMTGNSGLCLMAWSGLDIATAQNQAVQISAGQLSMTLATS
ncbi:hypothetical protein ACFVGM_08910 [Kitasatospora purpeofusca]|uniref:hypothetical protein n=1 Tax=Kitasatospora purpeofusca TaxID=67352 RepID=UPI003695E5F5